MLVKEWRSPLTLTLSFSGGEREGLGSEAEREGWDAECEMEGFLLPWVARERCGLLLGGFSASSATCQILTSPPRVGSPPPVANNLPSGLNRRALIRSLNGDEASPVPMVRSRF